MSSDEGALRAALDGSLKACQTDEQREWIGKVREGLERLLARLGPGAATVGDLIEAEVSARVEDAKKRWEAEQEARLAQQKRELEECRAEFRQELEKMRAKATELQRYYADSVMPVPGPRKKEPPRKRAKPDRCQFNYYLTAERQRAAAATAAATDK